MSAHALYGNIRSYLRLTGRVVEREGYFVEAGEEFTIRFSGVNAAYSVNSVSLPDIVFRNPRVWIEGTVFASPVGGNRWHRLPDPALYPGEASSVDVVFKADAHSLSYLFIRNELVARARIIADLDQNIFFRIASSPINVQEEIRPT